MKTANQENSATPDQSGALLTEARRANLAPGEWDEIDPVSYRVRLKYFLERQLHWRPSLGRLLDLAITTLLIGFLASLPLLYPLARASEIEIASVTTPALMILMACAVLATFYLKLSDRVLRYAANDETFIRRRMGRRVDAKIALENLAILERGLPDLGSNKIPDRRQMLEDRRAVQSEIRRMILNCIEDAVGQHLQVAETNSLSANLLIFPADGESHERSSNRLMSRSDVSEMTVVARSRSRTKRGHPTSYGKERLLSWKSISDGRRGGLVVNNLETCPGFSSFWSNRSYKSVLAIPIILDNECCGALCLDCEEKYVFSTTRIRCYVEVLPYLMVLAATIDHTCPTVRWLEEEVK